MSWRFVEPEPGQTVGLPKVVDGCPANLEGTLSRETSSTDGRRGNLFPTDIYLISGRTGQQFVAEVPEAAFDSVLYLVSPSGSLVAVNDDTAGGPQSRIQTVMTESGYWRLEVAGYMTTSTGPYRLNLQGCTALPQ